MPGPRQKALIVSPALNSGLRHWTSDHDAAYEYLYEAA